MKHKQLLIVCGCLCILIACAPNTPSTGLAQQDKTPEPANQETRAIEIEPQGSFFYELPQHYLGETASANGFSITLKQVNEQSGTLRLVLVLTNSTRYDVDLGWAVQLRNDKGRLVKAQTTEFQRNLKRGEQIEAGWQYEVNQVNTAIDKLQLIYAPRGWSGPVFVYRLVKR